LQGKTARPRHLDCGQVAQFVAAKPGRRDILVATARQEALA
jgi:hypothetical protein